MNEKKVYDFFSLLSAALNGEECQNVTDIDLAYVYNLSKSHSLVSAAYISAQPYFSEFENTDSDFLKNWKKEKNEAVFAQVEFDIEKEKIFDFLSAIGCWYVPLKGSIMKDYYINPAMREMGDVDILFDEKFAPQIKDFMVSDGYIAHYDAGNEDTYIKPPLYAFEMHRKLFNDIDDNVFNGYFKDIKSRLIPDKNEKYLYHFSDEDFYIYMIAHQYYHFVNGGTGLRALPDVYLYTKANGKTLDWEYIFAQSEKLGMAEYENLIRSISNKLLSYPQDTNLTEKEFELLEKIVYSRTYGTRENVIDSEIKSNYGDRKLTLSEKFNYYYHRIFLPKNVMKNKFPIVRKHPWLLPAAHLYRILIMGVPGFKRLWREVKIVWKK